MVLFVGVLVFNSISIIVLLLKIKIFRLVLNINTDMNINDFRGIHLGIRVSLVLV